MKTLLILLFLLFISCKNDNLSTLTIQISLEDSLVPSRIFLTNVKIYKNCDLFKSISPDFPNHVPQKIKLDSLDLGKYTIEYMSFFGDTIKKLVYVDSPKNYITRIYVDEKKYYSPNNLIGNLKNKQKLKIIAKTIGCFHTLMDSFYVSKADNQFYLTSKEKSSKLNESEKEYLIKLENKIRYLPKGSCTTNDEIIFTFGNINDTIYDSGCQFGIYNKITKFASRNGL